jgi:ATPase subunit of ABC transporter with duplicated ATPase domains
MPAISFHDVHFNWPDGDPVLDGLDLLVPSGRTGLVGRNGIGKSTLLRLITGELTPLGGTVAAPGRVRLLRQDLLLRADERVDEHLGISLARRALHAIESGATDPDLYDAVGDDWDVEERATATLERLGLPGSVLDRRLGELSGGECTGLALASLLLDRPDVLLLDEPTNNLDRAARERLYDVVAGYRGALVVVSHDRELLEHVDRIAELREQPGRTGARTGAWYGGGWTAYAEAVTAEQAAAEQAVSAARSDVRRQRNDLADAQVVLARRKRYGQKMYDIKREPRAVMKLRKRAAEVSAAKLRGTHESRLEDARDRLTEAEDQLRPDDEIRVDMPGSAVPGSREVLTLTEVVLRNGAAIDLSVRGPERVAVTGPNGSGKTTLLHTALGRVEPRSGRVDLHVPARLLPQRLDVLDPKLTVAENAAAYAPDAEASTVRGRLARFLFRGDAADQPVATLSGGELFRASLACLLLAEPTPQLLVLDEPTNNLDLASQRQLVSALAAYDGALLVASHDQAFLSEIGIDRTFTLTGEPV